MSGRHGRHCKRSSSTHDRDRAPDAKGTNFFLLFDSAQRDQSVWPHLISYKYQHRPFSGSRSVYVDNDLSDLTGSPSPPRRPRTTTSVATPPDSLYSPYVHFGKAMFALYTKAPDEDTFLLAAHLGVTMTPSPPSCLATEGNEVHIDLNTRTQGRRHISLVSETSRSKIFNAQKPPNESDVDLSMPHITEQAVTIARRTFKRQPRGDFSTSPARTLGTL
jgi:hypothetical protein